MGDPHAMMHGRLKDFFTISREKGAENLPLLSVTMRNGLVRRDSIDRKMDSELEDGEHLRVRPGDIAYNMMRMWQGASGLASEDGIVSPAYVVVRPMKSVDPLFASYWFKSERMIHLFWAYSYGITNDRLRLYPKDFGLIPVELPLIERQREIAAALGEIDRAIAATDALVEAKQRRKRALMQRVFATPEGEKTVRLGTLGRFESGRGVAKSDLADVGVSCLRYADIYTQYGDVIQELVAFVTDNGARNAFGLRYGDVVFAASGETALEIGKAVAYLGSEDAVVGGDTVILRDHGQDPGFLAHAVNAPEAVRQKSALGKGYSVVHIHAPDLANLKIWLPPLAKQKATSSALASFDDEIDLMNRQATALRQQKRGLIQKLLTGALPATLTAPEAVAA